MSGATVQNGLRCELLEHASGRVLEFVGFGFPSDPAFASDWPTAAGGVRYDAAGRPVLLHFAPARWLMPSPGVDVTALVVAAGQSTAGTMIDATGKWREYTLTGPDASRVLGCSIDSAAVLDGRDCAAVTLLDCPCVLARATDGFAIWVRSSFAVDFATAVTRLRAGS